MTLAFATNLADALSETGAGAGIWMPRLASALVLLLLGWVLGSVLSRWSKRIVILASNRLQQTSIATPTAASRPDMALIQRAVARVVFWFVLLFFAAAALEALGLDAVGSVLAAVIQYLPRVLAATVILIAGKVFAELAGTQIDRLSARSLGRTPALGGAVRLAIIALAVVVAVDQLGVDSRALVLSAIAVIATSLGGMSIAFGFGARHLAANIVAAHYVRQRYQVGDRVRVGEVTGIVREITRSELVLETSEGEAAVPARRCVDEVVTRLDADA